MKKLLGLILFLCFSLGAFAQEISEKRDIAIFRLSYYSWSIPLEALGSVDEEIKNVFINLGRFNVLGMTYRLESEDIGNFIAKIQEFKEVNTEIPREVLLGHAAFTEADFQRLVGSFIVVIPVLSYYDLSYDDESKTYSVTLETSFTFVNVEEEKSFAHFKIETLGSGENPNETIRSAVSSIPAQLSYEVRKIPLFQIKTGVMDISGRTALIQFGKDRGVTVGDEFAIIQPRILSSGFELKEETGLLVVKEVHEDFSYAYVLFASKGGPFVGDQLYEVPRFGSESAFYGHLLAGEGDLSLLAGVRQVATRGFYKYRPYVGLEFPLALNYSLGGFLSTLYLGAELNWYLGRIQITPQASAGISGKIPFEEEEEYQLSHAGGRVQLTVSYLLSKNVKLFLDTGYSLWYSIEPSLFPDLTGLFAGAGVTVKY